MERETEIQNEYNPVGGLEIRLIVQRKKNSS
jgi:hypothetical protein